ncbi:MAG: PAS domain-containing sensor histidine kinase [Bacteroidales bacterium]
MEKNKSHRDIISKNSTELLLLESILEHVPQSIFLLDKNKYIVKTYNVTPAEIGGHSVDDILNKSLSLFLQVTSSPYYNATYMLNEAFDKVYSTGQSTRFEYQIYDSYFEATISKVYGNYIISQVRNITAIIHKQQEVELTARKELAVALTAGGLTSWSYNVQDDIISSSHQNDIIGNSICLAELLNKIDPNYRKSTIMFFDNVIKDRCKQCEMIVHVEDLKGNMQWISIHAVPGTYSPNGEIISIIGSQKNITEKYHYTEKLKKTEREKNATNELLYTILDYMPSPLFIKDSSNDYKYIIANKLYCKILGLNESDIIGKTDYDLFPKEFADRYYREDCMVIDTNKICYVEGTVPLDNGKTVWLTTKAPFKALDNQKMVICIALDITERYNACEELKQATKKAEQSDNLKSAFLANMSHEIRTPLNAIVGFSRLISDTQNAEEREVYINIINSNSELLLKLINDILDLSKIESGYVGCNNNKFNLTELYRELEITFKDKPKKGVMLICTVSDEKVIVNLDKFRIAQVVTNFITNAIKFTTAGEIEIGYKIADGGVTLYVRDTGCGMTIAQISKVFNRFEKFNQFEQGTGLGTSICKAIVESYKGKIWVESSPGKGSTFYAYIPSEIAV